MHLDKTFWGLPWRPTRPGPPALERIENERRLRRELDLPPDVQAERLVRQAISRGTVHIRSHVDIDTEIGLRNFDGIMAARSRLKGVVSIQVVAFPAERRRHPPGTAELLERAVKDGAELIGGVDPAGIDQRRRGPARRDFRNRGTPWRGRGHPSARSAARPGAAQIRMIAARTRALGLAGKVAVSHAFCLGMVAERRGRAAGRPARGGPDLDHDQCAGRPADAAVRRLREAGVAVVAGSDGVRDAWTPFGTADMLERAMLLAYRNGFRTDALVHGALDIVTRGSAAVLGLARYGLEVGCRADFVVVPGETLGERGSDAAAPRLGDGAGRVIARDGHCTL